MSTGAIWKYILDGRMSEQVFLLPKGSRALSFHAQDDMPTLWVHVPDVTAPNVKYKFQLYTTGEPIKGLPGRFIGTALLHQGRFVLHLFELHVVTT